MSNVLPPIGQAAPQLDVDTVEGGRWTLMASNPEAFTLVVFYRGLHCPQCREYLIELDGLVDAFARRGTDLIAVSMDDTAHARQAMDHWGLDRLQLGCNLSEAQAQQWGLYFSTAVSDAEPPVFTEPGLFIVRTSGDLYYAAITSNPFGRPQPREILELIEAAVDNDYPARGKAEPHPEAA